MAIAKREQTQERSLAEDWLYAVRYYLGGRRAMFVLALAAIGAGLAYNWSGLVAVGIAPLLLSVLPCLVLCALGLCMHKKSGSPKSNDG